MALDLILVNGTIYTLDPAGPRVTAVVMRGGNILFAGDDKGALEHRTSRTQILDARGHLVLPGFTDAHVHFCGWAQGLDRIQLEGCHSLEEAAARVAARVVEARPGEWLIGWGWDHLQWAEPVMPDKRVLDQMSLDNPIMLTRKDGHSAWVNSAALQACGIGRDTPNPVGGEIERDSEGEPTGLIRENALELLGHGIGQSEEDISLPALRRAIRIAHSYGLTTVHDIEGSNALSAWQRLRGRAELNLRVVFAIDSGALEHALALGLRRGFGDEWLKVQAVKLFADGSLGSLTAEMFEPFVGSQRRGMALAGSEALLDQARRAARGGLDVWTHAIGDRAIDRVLSVYETLRGEGLSEPILRIEHVQHLRPVDLARFRGSNVLASVQPIHQPADMKMADALLGPRRARYSYAFASLRRAGASLALGSDCPVESIDPLLGIHAAVTRQNSAGDPPEGWVSAERLSAAEAVEGFTLGAAIASGDNSRAGTLSIGKRADAVILSENIFEIPPREILNARVEYTVAGGEVVYFRE